MGKTADPYATTGENELTEEQREKLFGEALSMASDRGRFRRIQVLHTDGSRSTFDRAASACQADAWKVRMVGADVLGQLGYLSTKPFWAESTEVLIPLLADDHPRVIESAVDALGHLGSDHGREMVQAGRAVCGVAAHPGCDVRQAVAAQLNWFTASMPEVVSTLIDLTRDRVGEVRNWACFSLRCFCDLHYHDHYDSPTVRNALLARLDDRHWDTRWEALAGLAVHADPRVRDRVLDAIRSGMDGVILCAYSDILDSVGWYHDPELCAAVRDAAEQGTYDAADLAEALAGCEEVRASQS